MKTNIISKAGFSFKLAFILASALLLLSACGKDDESAAPTADESSDTPAAVENGSEEAQASLNYLLGEWPPDSLIYYAQEKGYFEENGVDVNLVQAVGYEEVLEEKARTDIQYAWCYTMYEALIEKLTGVEPDLQVLYVQDYSFGADAVLAAKDSGIETIADLKGKTVGVEADFIGEFFIGILLQREGLTLADLNVIDIASGDIPAALASGEIEAGVAFQPAVSEAVSEGATIIADTTLERNVIADVCVARRPHIEANKEAYQNYVKSIFQAVDDYNENPNEAIEIMKGAFDMDPVELKEILETLKIPNLRENQTAFDRSSGFESLFTTAKQAEQFLLEQGVIEEAVSFGDLFDADLF